MGGFILHRTSSLADAISLLVVELEMAGTQPTLQNSTAAASRPAAGAGGPVHRPAQVLSGLLDDWTTLLTTTVTPETQDQHSMEVTRLKDQITQAKEDLVAEVARMTEEPTLDAQSQQIQAQNYQLMLD